MSELIGKTFRKDPRISQAKNLLKETLLEHQRGLTAIKPPRPEFAEQSKDLFKKCSELRGGNLYFPYLSTGLGKGCLVELVDGSVKYDFITGIGVHYFGHNHPLMLDAGIDAALEDTLTQGHLQQGEVAVEVMDLIVQTAARTGGGLKHCFLSSSGAMANENALKIIFQKHSPANRMLAFRHCFAGRSLILAEITDKPANREGLPKVLEVDYIPFFDSTDPKGSIQKAAAALNEIIARHPGKHAGMIFELVQGEGGYYAGEKEFFVALMRILKEKKIAVFIDEIQTLARTSRPFAFQHFGLEDFVDVVTFGKMSQVCGTLFTEQYKPKPNLISQTFTASSAAVYAGRAVFKELSRPEYWGPDGKIMKLGTYFQSRLKSLADRYPGCLSGPFGFGAMVGMTVLDGSAEKSKNFLKDLFDRGVIAFIAGQDPTRIRFLMPIGVVEAADIDAVVGIIEKTLLSTKESHGK